MKQANSDELLGTRHPRMVSPPRPPERVIRSGHQVQKLGARIMSGPREGWPIFQVTLEERATCPQSCPLWIGCIGDDMSTTRRLTSGQALEEAIVEEIELLARDYPDGFLIRLHTLGDFYSLAYVQLWADLMSAYSGLHIFGQTARRPTDPEPYSAQIGLKIAELVSAQWARFAIRTLSASPKRGTAIVRAETPRDGHIQGCRAYTGQARNCGFCGLCWDEKAKDQVIAFSKDGGRFTDAPEVSTKKAEPEKETAITPHLVALARAGDKIAVQALARKRAAGLPLPEAYLAKI